MPQDTISHKTDLEPRVAKLETGLEILTRDVTNLASIIREQSHSIEGEIQRLSVAVTQAGAPKKTEWPTLIAAGMLFIAVGSAVFAPLNQQANINKAEITTLRSALQEHTQAEGHLPVIRHVQQIDTRLNKVEANDSERNNADSRELRELRGILLKERLVKAGER